MAGSEERTRDWVDIPAVSLTLSIVEHQIRMDPTPHEPARIGGHLPQIYGQQAVVPYEPYPYQETDDEGLDLREIWRIVNKYRRTILLFMAIVLVTVAAATLIERPVYRATAVLEITPRNQNIVQFQNVEQSDYDPQTYRRTQAKIMESRAVAGEVVDHLDLATKPAFNGKIQQRSILGGLRQITRVVIDPLFSSIRQLLGGQPAQAPATASAASDDPNAAQRAALVNHLQGNLSVTPVRESNLFNVSFDSFSPHLAAQVTNAVAHAYIKLIREKRFEASAGAKAYLQKEIQQAQAKLESSEKAMNDYARKYHVVDLEDKNNIMSTRLQTLNDQLGQIRAQRIAAESLYHQTNQVDIGSLPAVLNDDLISTLKQDYAQLRNEYAKLSSIYKPKYPARRELRRQMTDARDDLKQAIDNRINSLKVNYDQLKDQEHLLQQAVAQQKEQLLDLQNRGIQYNILKREWQTNQQLYKSLLKRVRELGVATGLQADNASIIDNAQVPSVPYEPSLIHNASLALVLGLLGGVGLAFLLAFLDNTVRTPEELERLVHLPSLGLVPKVDTKRLPDEVKIDLLSHQMRDKDLSEAFRSIRTSLMFASPGGAPPVIQVTSTSQSEGKSTTTANLAIVLAQTGVSVLLVDADLRAPRLHKIFGVPRGPGLTEYLVKGELEEFYPTGIDKLSLLAAGTPPPNPAELLSSSKMNRLLEKLAGQFDYVIVDSVPVLGLADAVVMSTKVKGVVMVAAAGQIGKGALREAVKRLRTVRAPMLGAVLNMIEPNSSEYGYYSRYYYNYSGGEAKRLHRAAA